MRVDFLADHGVRGEALRDALPHEGFDGAINLERVNGKVITDVRVLVVPEWARIEIDDEVKADKRDQRTRKR